MSESEQKALERVIAAKDARIEALEKEIRELHQKLEWTIKG